METEAKPKIDPKWKANLLPENEKNVTIEDLKFIFTQAEKRMDDSIKNFDVITTKSVNFITFSTAILTALSAYFFSQFDPNGEFSEKLCTVLDLFWFDLQHFSLFCLMAPYFYIQYK